MKNYLTGKENIIKEIFKRRVSTSNENDYIIISDVDEIPNLTKDYRLKKYKFTVFEQKMFYYKINLHNQNRAILVWK